MSMPAQKARPAPVSTMARTAGSRPACSMALRSSASSTLVRAFICSGRLKVTVATGPSTR
jgi:hypothetical protein